MDKGKVDAAELNFEYKVLELESTNLETVFNWLFEQIEASQNSQKN